jgi:hypothetical protein
MLNIGLCVSVYMSLSCKLLLLSLYICEIVPIYSLVDPPFLYVGCTLYSYACCVSSMCWAYFVFGLFVLIDRMCSLYLSLKFLPVCSM